MPVTRINNNQITDSSSGNIYLGVNAAAKVQDFSVTGGKLQNNLTYGSDFTITGNLTVQGNTTTIDTVNLVVEDPLILLAKEQTGSPTLDIGFIGKRGTSDNIAFVWDESADEFVTVFTSSENTNTVITINSYASLKTLDMAVTGNLAVTGTSSFTGNITSANVTGNVNAANFNTAGLVTATGNVTGGNVTTGGVVTATGNIQGGNFLTGGLVSATGNVNSGNVNTGIVSATGNVNAAGAVFSGNVSAANFIGNIQGNISAAGANTQILFNDNSLVGANANLTFDKATSTFSVLGTIIGTTVCATGTVTGSYVYSTGELSAAGNVVAANVFTSGVVSATGNAIAGNILTGGLISATGTITSAANVSGANLVTGGVVTATGNIQGGNLLTGGLISATSTITSAANITGGNLLTGGLVSATGSITSAAGITATGNVTGGNITTGGVVTATGNVNSGNVNTGIVSGSGNITGANILTGGLVSATGNINGAAVNTALVASSGGISITSGGSSDLTLDAGGNINASSNYINNVASPQQDNDAASKIYVDNLVATGLTYHEAVFVSTTANLATTTGGTITYAQPNGAGNGIGATITTTGSFNLIDTGNVQTIGTRILVKDEGNAVLNGVYTWSNATAITRSTDADEYGTDSAQALSLNSYFFTESGNVNKGSAFVVAEPTGPITFGTSNIVFDLFSTSQVYSANTSAGLSLTGTVFSAKVDNDTTAFDGGGNISVKPGANLVTPNIGAATGTSLSVTGNITGGNLNTGGVVTATGNVTGGNINTAGLVTAGGNITGANLRTAGLITATGNIDVGNVRTAGVVTATGNVTGGNLLTAGLISSTGSITSAGGITATGNVTGGNVTTGGVVTATGNIQGGNILTGGLISATGNVNSGNVNTGIVSATGNVNAAGAVFSGNVTAANFIGNISGNIDAGGANTQVQFNDNDILNGSSNFTFNKATNVMSVTGTIQGTTVSSTGNVVAGNVTTGGLITATGNVTGGNILTAGLISATSTITSSANVTGANLVTGGLVTATGNVTGGNLNTGGLITATGNITGANLILTSGTVDGPAGGRITINGSDLDTDFAVDSDTVPNIFYVDAGTSTASFGNSTQTTNAIVSFQATNSILMPRGNTVQRPGTGVIGMLRFNTTGDSLEVYTSTGWEDVGVPAFTVITADSFTGNGSQTVYTLSNTSTTAATIVSINGVVQIPTTAYSVSGNTLTFTEAPAVSDTIDARLLTTTTTVTAIENTSANAVVEVLDTAATVQITGNLLPAANVTYDIGSNSMRWNDAYFNGTSITLGNIIIKNNTGTTIGFFGPDGTTPATIDSTNIDTTTIANGTSSLAVIASGGNIRANVGGATVQTIASTGVLITGVASATGNITGNFILGNGSQLTGIDATSIQSGTSNVRVQSSGGNVSVGVGGSAILRFTTAGIVNDMGNGVGNIGNSTGYFNTIFAKATSAQYADLAEMYEADGPIEPGTVVAFGGAREVTTCSEDSSRRVAGVVSTNPSYIMNAGLAGEHVIAVALTGRVPTRVTGTIQKGDMLVAAGGGRARAEADPQVGAVIGKALADFDGAEGTIEVVVGRL